MLAVVYKTAHYEAGKGIRPAERFLNEFDPDWRNRGKPVKAHFVVAPSNDCQKAIKVAKSSS